MPHCVIEYSRPLLKHVPVSRLMTDVHQAVITSQLFEPEAIKVRATGFDDHRVGQTDHDFIHVSLRILSGRDGAQKSHLSAIVLESLKQIGLSSVCLTVEVIDMDRESYAKHTG